MLGAVRRTSGLGTFSGVFPRLGTSHRPDASRGIIGMEFLNFLIILWAGWLLWRRPEQERLAFGLLMASVALMALLFFHGTRGSLVPGVNL